MDDGQLSLRFDDPERVEAERLYAAFRAYHAKNPHLWRALEAVTLRLIGAHLAEEDRRRHFSIQAVYEQLRYYRPEAGIGHPPDYKINNIFRPFYIRGFCKKYPEYRQLFEYRRAYVDLIELNTRLFGSAMTAAE